MTAIAGVVGDPNASTTRVVSRMLEAMPGRGDCPSVTDLGESGSIGASVFEWQRPWAYDATGRCGHVHVVADATLYYCEALLEALQAGDVIPESHRPADLIAAAVQRWQEDAPLHLEGDFAFVAVDTRRGRILAARDWSGLRSLYFARTSAGLAFATEVTALAALEGVDTTLNLPWLCEAASGRFESPTETVYRGIQLVPAGHVLARRLDPSEPLTYKRFFTPPRFLGDETPAVSFAQAAKELRSLLETAVRERLPSHGDVVVALSGGRDSAAVYALARQLEGDRIRSVTVSYPEGDPGREDDIVRDVLQMSGGTPHWIDSRALGVLGSIAESASSTPEPFAHVFAEFQVGLAKAARELGSRVLLNGSGGDQFFSGEPTYLADLLRRGRLFRLVSEWRALEGGRDWRAFFKLVVWPNLGRKVNALLTLLRRGRAMPDPFDRPLAPWINTDRELRRVLAERHRLNFPSRRDAAGAADYERRWLLTHPFFPRVFAEAYRLYLKHGVELRTPLADLRVMRFAATRPRWERRSGWEMKLLLRSCLNNVLPGSVTGPRRRPTGTTEVLLRSAFQVHVPSLLGAFNGAGSRLQSLGVVDEEVFVSQVHSMLSGSRSSHEVDAIYTLIAELWMETHIGGVATRQGGGRTPTGPRLAE